jgi:hypothetical protein
MFATICLFFYLRQTSRLYRFILLTHHKTQAPFLKKAISKKRGGKPKGASAANAMAFRFYEKCGRC